MRTRFQALVGGDGGFALPTVLAVVFIALGMASAAAVASSVANRGSVQDEDRKAAIAAADAGAGAALTRENTIVVRTGSTPCLTPGAGGLLYPSSAQADGWCEPITGNAGSGTYSYRVRPPDAQGDVEVVSTGASDTVSRRVAVSANTSGGPGSPFAGAGVVGRDEIAIQGNAVIFSNAATNGSIVMSNNSLLCGSASHGTPSPPADLIVQNNSSHGGASGPSSCSEPEGAYPVLEQSLSLPDVVQPADLLTNNSNSRFFTEDVIGGNPNKVIWDSSARALELKSNTSLTLGGADYSFCTLTLASNTTLFIAAGANVRMFFDSPEACGLPSGTAQLQLSSNSRITATDGNPSSVAVLFVGSDDLDTSVQLYSNSSVNGGCANTFVIYAPKTDIDVNSNSSYCGAIAGKTVHLDSNSSFTSDDGAASFMVPGTIDHYSTNRYVECTGASGSPPDSGC